MLAVLAVAFSFGMLILSVLLGKVGRRTGAKDIPYECGMLPQGEGNSRLSVKFYLVAMLFILFDIEVMFFLPFAVTLREFGAAALVVMGVFIVILEIGHYYAWKKGALEWE